MQLPWGKTKKSGKDVIHWEGLKRFGVRCITVSQYWVSQPAANWLNRENNTTGSFPALPCNASKYLQVGKTVKKCGITLIVVLNQIAQRFEHHILDQQLIAAYHKSQLASLQPITFSFFKVSSSPKLLEIWSVPQENENETTTTTKNLLSCRQLLLLFFVRCLCCALDVHVYRARNIRCATASMSQLSLLVLSRQI